MEYTILLVIEVLAALGLVGLILLQQGKGAEMGASFGAGASQTIFGSSGSGNFMTRLTSIFATVFFITCLGLAYLANQDRAGGGDTVDFSSVTEKVDDAGGSELPAVSTSKTTSTDDSGSLPDVVAPSVSVDEAQESDSVSLPEDSEMIDAEVAYPADDEGVDADEGVSSDSLPSRPTVPSGSGAD